MTKKLGVTIHLSGLITYALKNKQIDAIIPANGVPRHDEHHADQDVHAEGRPDAHLPALVIPMSGLSKASSAPDQVFQVGNQDVGLWRLEGVIVDVWRDGEIPEPRLDYERHDDLGNQVTRENEGDLHWLPNMKRVTGIKECEYRPDCLPPNPDPKRVSAIIRMLEGRAQALWPDENAQKEQWQFVPPVLNSDVASKPYDQPFADGLTWTFGVDDAAEIRLTGMGDRPVRSIYLASKNRPPQPILTISNKPSTVNGVSVLQASDPAHFDVFHDLVQPSPGILARRKLVRLGDHIRENRCPGSSL